MIQLLTKQGVDTVRPHLKTPLMTRNFDSTRHQPSYAGVEGPMFCFSPSLISFVLTIKVEKPGKGWSKKRYKKGQSTEGDAV